jgi:hypothetical protein
MGRQLRRIPLPLALLLAVALVESVAWATLLPPMQGPDEIAHFAYTQKLVEAPTIPWHHIDAQDGRGYSTEVNVATRWAQLSTLAQNVAARPAWTSADERLVESHLDRLGAHDRADGLYVSAMQNPPAYYLYEAVPYVIASSGSLFTRAYLMRLANVPLLLIVVAAAWLLGGELFAATWRRTVVAALVALNPQLIHASAIVNPDIALAALWSVGLLVAVRTVRHGLTPQRVASLAAVSVLSPLTQPRGLPFVAAAAVAVAWAWVARRRRDRAWLPSRALGWTAGAAILIASTVGWLAEATRGDLSGTGVRRFLSYLWQFYLPRPGFMTPTLQPNWTVRDVFVDRFYGTFAQLDVFFPQWLDRTLAIGSAVGLACVVAALVARRATLRRAAGPLAVLVVAAVTYILGLHAAAWRNLLIAPGDPILTGRYLLPLIALFGVCVVMVTAALPRRAGAFVGAGIVGVGILVQFAAIGAVAARFYA